MLRSILIVVALLIVAVLGATALGLLDFTQTKTPDAPPKFNVKVNEVQVGTTTKQVEVPTLQIDNGSAPANNGAAPANTQ